MSSEDDALYTSYTSASEDIGSQDTPEEFGGLIAGIAECLCRHHLLTCQFTTPLTPAGREEESPSGEGRGEVPGKEETPRHRRTTPHDRGACVEPAPPKGSWTTRAR
ncbi:hypothetical protein CDAR_585621 [Caerostris darwini]|uniref:Uncharacterized protein n=1 Tax=Caerostris darwini TaxID=1538125 RepID=A0AAV4RX56_9ARAC|nr:hypothetical protein CDAR_585621 [Caerostris darwini]